MEMPRKQEGDGCSPPGFFPLPPCSGAAPASELFGTVHAPIWATPAMGCIDDPDSRHYNRIVDASQGVPTGVHARTCGARTAAMNSVPWSVTTVILRRGRFVHIPACPGARECRRQGYLALPREDMLDLIRWLDREQALCWCNCRTPNIPPWLPGVLGRCQLADCGGA